MSAQATPVTAFDEFADTYDATFTNSSVGRAQRDQVWSAIANVFRPGDRILELNCGTGEDAAFLSSKGVCVVACDSSSRMVEVARARNRHAPNVHVQHLATESVLALRGRGSFDGAFSNFSGLNCVHDVGQVAADLALLLSPGAPLVVIVSTRWCIWEFFWYAAQLDFAKAVRRWRGSAVPRIGGSQISVWYASASQIARQFSPHFTVSGRRPIALFVPPSYAECFVARSPKLLNLFKAFDRTVCRIPLLSDFGDHMLLHFVRNDAI